MNISYSKIACSQSIFELKTVVTALRRQVTYDWWFCCAVVQYAPPVLGYWYFYWRDIIAPCPNRHAVEAFERNVIIYLSQRKVAAYCVSR